MSRTSFYTMPSNKVKWTARKSFGRNLTAEVSPSSPRNSNVLFDISKESGRCDPS